LTALALAVLAERATIPPGVLNIITGDALAIGKIFTGHPSVRFVGFTGSTEVGKLVMSQAASTVKRVGLELEATLHSSSSMMLTLTRQSRAQ
jgi:succinate-semialdehyde dehydrogenase / glutarate-semialdehyde dehydrogenase